MHYLYEGRKDAAHTFLCLHGQPTWSYLYRKMIPVFVAAGHRVVAPDLFGFGKSDKPTDETTYTFDFHRQSLVSFIEVLDLRNITLVCQDWGGILELTIPPDMPDRFHRLIAMNTAIPLGESEGAGFDSWRTYNRSQYDLDICALMMRATPGLRRDEADAYDAPFPDQSYKAGVKRFPELVMTNPGMPGVETAKRSAKWWRESWAGQSFMAIGVQDPVLGPKTMERLRATIYRCPPPLEIAEAGHFVQEQGAKIALAALSAFRE